LGGYNEVLGAKTVPKKLKVRKRGNGKGRRGIRVGATSHIKKSVRGQSVKYGAGAGHREEIGKGLTKGAMPKETKQQTKKIT